jgi:hypothetical protein
MRLFVITATVLSILMLINNAALNRLLSIKTTPAISKYQPLRLLSLPGGDDGSSFGAKRSQDRQGCGYLDSNLCHLISAL